MTLGSAPAARDNPGRRIGDRVGPMTSRKIGTRGLLAMSFAIAMLAIAVSGAVQFWGMVRLDRAATGMRQGDTALANAAGDLREDVLELRRYEKDVFMNIGTDELVRQYRDKWDRALVSFRYDLARARRVDPAANNAPLQQVTDQIAAYRVAFTRIYDSIENGTVRTTQQANEEMSPFKSSVRDAELELAEISGDARDREFVLGPAVTAQRIGLAISAAALLALAIAYFTFLGRMPAASPAVPQR